MLTIVIVDPNPRHPQFDYQTWTYLSYPGTAIPIGRSVGEWSWVGRNY